MPTEGQGVEEGRLVRLKGALQEVTILIFLLSSAAFAATDVTIPTSGLNLPDPNSLITPTVATAVVKSIGLGMDHHPFQGASPLGLWIGMSFGVELIMVQPPSDLSAALDSIVNIGSAVQPSSGSSSPSSTTTSAPGPGLPILPSMKLHLEKGLGPGIDIGASVLPSVSTLPYFGGSFLIGGDIKIALANPEEGVAWALRGSYNLNDIKLNYSGQDLQIKTGTYSVHVLASKKMTFAEPYLGIAGQYTMGSVKATINIPTQGTIALGAITLSQNGDGFGGYAFGGLDLKIPSSAAGVRITLEGAYSPFGMNYLGTKLGLSF